MKERGETTAKANMTQAGPFVLWLEWRGFYADETAPHPEIVVREGSVLDANRAARRRGVSVGMSVAEARNIVPDVGCRPWIEEEVRPRAHAWLDLLLPYSHRVEPIDGHIAAVDLSDHPRPLEVAERLMDELVHRVKLPLSAGAGASKWMAQLAATKHDLRGAIANPARFLARWPVEEIRVLPPEQRERLAFLGYRAVGEVAKLPLAVLRAQFGEASLRILQAARGSLADPVVACYPPDTVSAALTFDGPPDTVETLERGYSRLAEELAEMLAARASIAKRVELTLEREDGGRSLVRRTFARPLVSPRDLFVALRLLLPTPPEDPVVRLRVTLPDVQKARRVQLDVDDRRARLDAEASLQAAVANVRTVFGEKAVLKGTEVPQPRWILVRRAYRDAYGWAWI